MNSRSCWWLVAWLLCTLPGNVGAQEKTPVKKAAEQAEEPKPAAPRKLPGMQKGGEILLPTQWSLRPAGKQLKLGDFPVNIALHPKEPWAAVLHAGYGDHEIVIVDLKSYEIVSRANLKQAFYGLCFDPAGERVFASGAEYEVVHEFKFAKGYLSDRRELKIGEVKDEHVPAGVTCSPDGKTLFVACAWGDTLAILPLDDPTKLQHVPLEEDSYPYASLLAADGRRLYISLWGKSSVAVLNLETRKVDATWPTASHPTELLLSPKGDVLYVACQQQPGGRARRRLGHADRSDLGRSLPAGS